MKIEKQITNVDEWTLVGRNDASRPYPENPGLSPTDHIVVNRSSSGWTRSLSFDRGKTYYEPDKVSPRNTAHGPYNCFLLNDVDGLLEKTKTAATNKALVKLSDVQFDLGVFLAELPETMNLVTSGATEIIDGYRKASKRADRADRARARLRRKPPTRSILKKINNLTNLIASIWLSYRYGVMPLYYALVDAVELFEKGLDKSQLKHVRASAKATITGIYWNGERPITQTGSITCRASILATCKPDFASSLGLDNPALIAWELVPLSFVFDWFVNVGDYLLGLNTRGKTFVSGTVSTKVDSQIEGNAATIVNGTLVVKVSAMRGHSQSYVRSVLTGLPKPKMELNPSLNLVRYADALALSKLIFLSLDKYSIKK